MTTLRSELGTSFQRHKGDTGSTEVQIALLTEKITNLTDHFKTHAKDFGSKRGLLIMVGRRRKLLDYLKQENYDGYKNILQKLGLRR